MGFNHKKREIRELMVDRNLDALDLSETKLKGRAEEFFPSILRIRRW